MSIHRHINVATVTTVVVIMLLTACGIEPQDSPADGGASSVAPVTSGGEPSPSVTAVGGGEPEDELQFANWPLYIDQDDEGNSPTLQQFEEATGVDVTYTEGIEDNNSFFGTIQPALAAGDDTGYDIIVMTDWMIGDRKSTRLNSSHLVISYAV